MESKKDLRENGSKNKGMIYTCIGVGTIIIGGMSYIIFKQQIEINKINADIKLLKEVLHGNIIHSLRETYKRKLRYHEGRLANGIATSGMTDKDILLRKEEIAFLSSQLEKLDAAEKLISS